MHEFIEILLVMEGRRLPHKKEKVTLHDLAARSLMVIGSTDEVRNKMLLFKHVILMHCLDPAKASHSETTPKLHPTSTCTAGKQVM